LGKELNRPIEFVVLNRDELIPALVDGRINIIMSGMSVTKARQLRVAFTQPYVHNQVRAIFPIQAAASFKTPGDLINSTARVGVIPGTTAELFVKQKCLHADIVKVTMRRDAAFFLLKGNRIDVFVDDTFALADILSQHEADISYMKQPIAEEDLAWGCRPGDELLPKVNAILEKWKSNGTLDGILERWIPYLKKLSSPKSTE
jgi:ABC-type amino acid transport substrate-binding protein